MARKKTVIHSDGKTEGYVGLGYYGGGIGTVKQQVYDGDTIIVRGLGNFGVRFLGIDTAEMKLPLPGETSFISLADPKWEEFLADPFRQNGPLSPSPFSSGLTEYLQDRTGPGVAANHRRFAEAAEDQLEEFVQTDLTAMGIAREDFAFYLRFAFEIMDRYGRFLCFINRYQPDENVPSPRPPDYNTRMLRTGIASPYFIWPNVNPWRAFGSVTNAVLAPGTAKDVAEADLKLNGARQAVKAARQSRIGIFDSGDSLRVEAFEVRYLSRASGPSRWVIDLSENDDLLIHPENYHTIPLAEDRLYIPSEYVPLFVEAGWRRQPAPA